MIVAPVAAGVPSVSEYVNVCPAFGSVATTVKARFTSSFVVLFPGFVTVGGWFGANKAKPAELGPVVVKVPVRQAWSAKIGANSVVLKDVPPGMIAVGLPAIVLHRLVGLVLGGISWKKALIG